MWRKIRYFLLFLCLFLVVAGIVKDKILDTPAMALKKMKDVQRNAVKAGGPINSLYVSAKNKVAYNVYFYSIFPMGKMYFTVEKEKEEFIYSFEVTTNDTWMKRFIEADASVQAHLDKKSFLTTSYLEKTKVNDEVKTKEIVFDHKKLIAQRDDVKIKILENTYDPVGAFMRAITAQYDDQKSYEFKFLSKKEIYILKSSLISKSDDLYEISLEMFREDSSSNHGARIFVWVTADEARIPILFKSWMPAGYASVVIDSIEIPG